MKKCIKCKQEKEVSLFHKEKSRKDGYSVYCKDCANKIRGENYYKDLERSRESKRRQAKKYNKEAKIRGKKWYEENKDYRKKQIKEYRENNKEWYCEYQKKWRLKNPDKVKAKQKKFRKTEKGKALSRMNGHNREARIRGAEGKHTLKEWNELKIKHDYTCLHCKKKEPVIKLTQDHIIPISKGGNNYISNIQPLCNSCNSKKHNKI